MKHLDIQDTEMFVVREEAGESGPAPGPARTASCTRLAAQKIDESIAYMREHLNKPLQVAKLAALVNVSASHYFALFKRRTGSAPIDFFIRMRMSQACRLLGGTTLSVKEIAAALGYEDPFYFSRMFKSVVRVAPSEYRLLNRPEDPMQSTQPPSFRTRLNSESRAARSAFMARKSASAPEDLKSFRPSADSPACAVSA